jgi:hypothetical protein
LRSRIREALLWTRLLPYLTQPRAAWSPRSTSSVPHPFGCSSANGRDLLRAFRAPVLAALVGAGVDRVFQWTVAGVVDGINAPVVSSNFDDEELSARS